MLCPDGRHPYCLHRCVERMSRCHLACEQFVARRIARPAKRNSSRNLGVATVWVKLQRRARLCLRGICVTEFCFSHCSSCLVDSGGLLTFGAQSHVNRTLRNSSCLFQLASISLRIRLHD